jgi:hypothetical protein
MNRISFPIEPGSEGAALDDLQAALALFLDRGEILPDDPDRRQQWSPILQLEQAQHSYGEMTASLVSRFQTERHLQATGVVDVLTASSINAILDELGVLDGQGGGSQVVEGLLRYPDESPSVGTLIFAFDPEFLEGARLGEASTNNDGHFRIAYDPTFYTRLGPGVDHVKAVLELVVAACDEASVMIASSEQIPNPPPQLEISLMVGELRFEPASPEPPAQAAAWTLRGRVVDALGRGLSEYLVNLLEYDLDGTTPIDSTRSGTDGEFEFNVVLSDELRSGDDHSGLDLLFQISDQAEFEQSIRSIALIGQGPEMFVPRLAESENAPMVLMNISADLVVLVAVGSDQRPLTEFEQLVARLSPFMRQTSFADLKEDHEHFQISFLNNETRVEKAKIEQLRDAFQQERASNGVPAWAFFGLAALGFGLTSLASMPVDELAAILAPLQPAADGNDLAAVAQQLQQYLAERDIQTQISTLKTSVGDILQPVLDSDEKLHDFLDAYIRHEGDTESFWKGMGENPEFQAEVSAIQLNLQLSQLTLSNLGLAKALQQEGIANTRQLVDLSNETWEALALEHKAGIPAHIIGEDDQARSKVYAQELQTLVELAFPTDMIKKSVRDAESATFLDNNPDFDFTRTPVETYLFERGEQAFDGIQNPDEVKSQLRKMQRMYTLTSKASDMHALLDQHYESAHQISMLSVEDFARSLEGKISLEDAHVYHAKALGVSDAAAEIYHQLRELAISPAPQAIENPAGGVGPLQRIIPNWESLFSSLDICECEHCKSVYSPAAYFVDLLHILLGQNGGAARKAIFRRRPDLLYTKLSCAHTETLIPYIDLVNEVLETYVAQGHVGDDDAKAHARFATQDTSSFTASDLAANPQHPNPDAEKDAKAAYAKLEGAAYPLNLPFDMNLETARQFLQEQNSSRFAVMKTFGNAVAHATSAEGIGISEREFEILTLKQLDGVTDAGIDTAQDLWGIPAGQTLSQMVATVDDFLARTSIAYTDLIGLLSTRFLNPNFPINAYLQGLSKPERDAWLATHPDEELLARTVIELGAGALAPCDLSNTRLLHLNADPLSDNELSRFNRFIRLWKKLGCTITELDGLLIALEAADLTPQVVQDLSILWQVQQHFRLPLDRLAVLVGNIPTAGEASLFARLLLNKAILQIDAMFALNVGQTELENTSENLADHVPAILAAFRISEEELHQILEVSHLNLTADKLNLANLSKIYRYVVFAQGLRMKIKELITWLKLMSLPAWATPADLLKTQELLATLQLYGFKAADFAYIFQGERASGHTLSPSTEVITQSAKTLREGLLKVQQENSPKDGQVTVDFLNKELGILLEPAEVAKVIGILDGSNTANPFDYLLAPSVSGSYKDILQDYLTPVDVAVLAATTDNAERFDKYWGFIETRLLPVLRVTFVQQHLVAAFKVEAVIVALILQDAGVLQACLNIETDTTANRQAYAEQYVLMHKFTWLVANLKLTGKEISHFEANPNFGGFHWKTFDFGLWLRLADFVALRDSLAPAESDLLSISSAVNNGSDVVAAIVAVTAWDKANVAYFVAQYTPSDFLNEVALIVLQRQLALSKQIGVSIEKLASWATARVTYEQAQGIKRTLKAKYDEVAWVEVSATVHNRLRTHLRDALVAYLLQKPEIKALNLKNANDLYAYFLIDVEMDACMQTSRLKQAIASVQLFAQRCLLNLEEPNKITPNMCDAEQWKWMKNYRVWEANRKVFLYPENWIEPELRDNKSPFFKELESELLQAELTDEIAEQKVMHYLEKLDEVARLDICGIYEDDDAQELHVFGRAFNTPPQYFYRKLNLTTQVWTAWERVPLDIQGNEEGDSAGVHLMPVVWNRRLYLFWPIFTEKPDKEKIRQYNEDHKQWKKRHDGWKDEVKPIRERNQTNHLNNLAVEKKIARNRKESEELERMRSRFSNNPLMVGYINNKQTALLAEWVELTKEIKYIEREPEAPVEPDEYPWAYYEVRIAWSEYREHKWSNKRVSQSFIKTESDNNGVAGTWAYRFLVQLGSTLTIELWRHDGWSSEGTYQFNCNGKIMAMTEDKFASKVEVIAPKQMSFYQSFLALLGARTLNWNVDESLPLTLLSNNGKKTHEILGGSEKEYKILFPADHTFSDFWPPNFIYQDHKRDYHVEDESDRYSTKVASIQNPKNIAISTFMDKPSASYKRTDGVDPALYTKPDRFSQLSPAILDELVDDRQIETSAALKIRSTQTLAGSTPDLVAGDTLPSAMFEIGRKYLALGRVSSERALKFKPLFHAYVCKFMAALNRGGINDLLTLQNQQLSDAELLIAGLNDGPLNISITSTFTKQYRPRNVTKPYPIEDVDFSTGGAYSLYNWELFFHVPMLIANRLSANQRFEEAMRWYHFVFNPTTNDKLNSPARFWQVIPFRNTKDETLDSLMKQLHNLAGDPKRKGLEAAIMAWRKDPFNPHLIARMRLIAYQKTVVMKYLDNLIAWGDYLFRQDTMESINEATQLYILAAEICGKRPEKIPARGKIEALNYAELEDKGLDAFSNALVQLETTFPFFNVQAVQAGVQGTASILNTTTPALYFCLPDNEKLMGYWDTIADRLFKIRHCQNIEGVERQLALFEPPIDPALLVRAAAGGIDFSSVLADLNSPLPYYRFSYIVQKALEMCAELRALGNNLLGVLEKRDAEALSTMRSQHETMLLNLAKTVRKLQVTEAQRSREGLEKTRDVTEHRTEYYTQLVQEGLNSSEKEHQTLSALSMVLSVSGQALQTAASVAQLAPDVEVGAIAGAAGGPTTNNRVSGGDKTAKALTAFGSYFQMLSTMTTWAANSAQTSAGYQRRAADWKLQQDLATKELAQIDKQILAAEIREQVAEQELSNIEQQIDNARQIEEFLRNKYTKEELYGWMVGELSTIYFQCYQLAYDLAKKAEKSCRHELGLPASNFLQFGIWDSFRKGLLSGERLYLSLKQMEKSYMDQNRREYEITKHVFLQQHMPLKLIELKETGTCTIELPETLFDLDFPGHYMRRIKSVRLTIPCVVGPAISVNCTLTLLRSKTRISADAGTYAGDLVTENKRVITNFAALESIATSSAQNDSGLFELNFRDERYLPFEGSGAISLWRIDLPKEFRQFDYDTISDIVLQISYTARQGGDALKKAALDNLADILRNEASKPQARLFSLRHEFPSEWHRLQNVTDENGDHSQAFSLAKHLFPFVFQGGKITVSGVDLFGVPKSREGGLPPAEAVTLTFPQTQEGQIIIPEPTLAFGELVRWSARNLDIKVEHLGDTKKEADWTLKLTTADSEQVEDILFMCHYSVDVLHTP